MTRRHLLLLLFVALLLSACDSDAPATSTDTDAGADTSADTSSADAEPADTSGADARDVEADAAPFTCAPFPAPRVGEGEAAAALAASPGVCGTEGDWSWLTDGLGAPVEVGPSESFLAVLLQAGAESAGIDLGRSFDYDVAVRPYRYITQERGRPVEATSLVAYPTNWDGEGIDMLLFLHGTVGFADACAPSRSSDARLLLAAFASLGYVVVAPDYIGLKASGEPTGFLHPYLVPQPTAHASLDALRAVGAMDRESELAGLCVQPRFVTLGGSQGGHAALWVDRMLPYYASELELLGTVATVPPADVLAQAERALQSVVPASANFVAVLATHADWYDRLDTLPTEVFASEAVTTDILSLLDGCDFGGLEDIFTTLDDVYHPDILAAAQSNTLVDYAPWGCYAQESGLVTTSIPRINTDADAYGVLWVMGEQDDLVNTPIERESFHTLCSQGMPSQYLECEGASHTAATGWALPEIVRFVEARFAGERFAGSSTCEATAPVVCEGTP